MVLDAVTPATTEQITGVLDILIAIAKAILGVVGDVAQLVMSQPLLLIPIGVVMLYTIIRVFKSIF